MNFLPKTARDLLAASSALFTYLDEDVYREIATAESCATLPALPGERVHAVTQSHLFVAGMPLAALPIESHYRPWSTGAGGVFGSQKGLYGGESASHLTYVYELLGLEIPQAFSAMPDHLTLIADLIVVLYDAGEDELAAQVARDHFGWLGSYADALAKREGLVDGISAFSEEKKRDLHEGIRFYQALVEVIDGIVACSDTGSLSQSA